MAKKDVDKQTTNIRRNPNSKDSDTKSYSNKRESSSMQKSASVSKGSEKNERGSLKTSGNPHKLKKYSGKTEKPEKKKSLKKRVKEVLPSKRIIESEDDFRARNNRQSPSTKSKGQSRREYVTEQKNTGGKYTPRTEVKKGWGKKGKVTKRKMEE